ncbi:MAG TPA: tRNA (adenosine(37)-N6)-threonylcarbamoyltransferase complex dimerization subunit type 1 TsaB [Porphyromonadaceae bacterium]|jgi:tRNA threonylcarbamoyladenosine biosynthesis protein TsaB|uniref:tRNA (adenosine(37)-N6)-threonylcarbamoyltransferase complex dimerization subunit type 1 TsaB n=1 Tax=Limibacterium fermenti TaxID=3229863 RepID=UPI000E89EF8B|nr:tRNA (adenosine(37)-N6)-threonylcarbamoyltransferase complex dimerization subunit type 1 TsaB [Porphyromonadaceae bacterium]HBL34290.1 tRNA (adenosine(37)-N6)-threonylcarbamoyltransferase complex dimerization subunit type 1 TsaB [Porphyromonadaceae bacterium]HBX20989.1 tRNA (adenosine(37)-N6)-threonylcarbamoyltransferase complex dimerization subunit type 1 TsaB [Porphyromonadaceae bacterium]HBX47056.1 tRNA (adenosine(37)-N6)-threonylcarbamoyltransferase complex dimerization subunit type 1 Tsa
MAIILHIETSTQACSCALSRDGAVIVNREEFEGQKHAALLGVFVEDIMTYAREKQLTVDAVAVSSGPGSYTGLRIGVSEAKGLSYGLNVPLIAVPTHLLMASQVQRRVEKDALLCPMIDARRMEVYAAFFDTLLNMVRPTAADIVTADSYAELLEQHTVYFFGNGADKCRQILTHPHAVFIPSVYPLASGMVALAEKAYAARDFVDTAYFEPFYLKEFVATVAKNKVIPG